MISVPYETSGQQLGETRLAMTKTLMKDIEKITDELKDRKEKYYILVHGKPASWNKNQIVIKIIKGIPIKPHMMLSCMLFGVDNQRGVLTLEWSLPGDWPTWAVGGSNEPIPETIASMKASKIKYYYEDFFPPA
jgi:hypothetical protein